MLLLASSVCGLFKWRQYEPEVILLAVGWYLRFSLSYRDVEELLAERGLLVDHVTVWRWVQRYAPEIQRRLRLRLRPTNDSWRVDETYIRVKGKWVYLYRAVDSSGATIDFLLSAKRNAAAAERIPARFSDDPIAILGIIAENDADLAELARLESLTDEQVLAENDLLPGIGIQELVFGVLHARIINGAFSHANPFGSRFNGPTRGA
jgi:transposase, IS6 family